MALPRRTLTRRTLIRASASAAALLTSQRLAQSLAAQEAPAAIKREGARPQIAEGTAAGDVGHDRAMIWSRCDRPARMIVEWDKSEKFTDSRRVPGPAAIESTDFTAKFDLRELPPGERIFYRVQFQDLGDLKTLSAPAIGMFKTPTRPDGNAADVKV